MPEFQPYLDSIAFHYDKWWRLYTLTDAEGEKERSVESFFDFGLMVQTIAPKDSPELGDRPQPKIERLPVTEGLQKYAIDHVLLVGRPGSGKSTALARLMLDLVRSSQIPVLVELRSYQSSVLELIRSSFKRHDLSLTIAQIEMLLDDRKLILLIDGVNELPSESARMDLSNFRRNYSKVSMIFTTRDLSLGGNLGIEKQLEMQPLTETQMRSFINAYLPGKADAMLGQLKDRLREFGTTPLLLWMLCSLFKRTEVIPQNLGEVFRAFTRGYEQQIKHDVVLESDRRLWFDLLKQLAVAMMQGEKPTEFRVAIAPAEICAVFADYLKTENPLVPRQALDDLLKHHLIQRNGELVEFRHQLIQEYYAAEWLLERIGQLDDETLECDYLNYLKWTEPLALMLALVDDEALAVRVVERALAIDSMLGARLSGEVRSYFQPLTLQIIYQSRLPSGQNIPPWFKVEILGRTKTSCALQDILAEIKHEDYYVRESVVSSLRYFKNDLVINTLVESLNDDHSYVRRKAIDSLTRIDVNYALPYLLDALADNDEFMQQKAVLAIQNIDEFSHSSILIKIIENLSSEHSHIRSSSIRFFGERGINLLIPELVCLKSDPSKEVRKSFAMSLSNMGKNEETYKILTELILDPDQGVCGEAVISMSKLYKDDSFEFISSNFKKTEAFIRGSCALATCELSKEVVIDLLLSHFNDSHEYVRGCIASSLGRRFPDKIGSKLNSYLKDEHEYVRGNAAESLAQYTELSIFDCLVENYMDPHEYVRAKIIISIGMLGQSKVREIILERLRFDCHDYVRGNAAIALNYLNPEKKIMTALVEALSDPSKHVYAHAAQAIVNKAGYSPEVLAILTAQIHLPPGKSIFRAVQGIQANCKFYNYEIYQKAIGRTSTARASPSSNTYAIKAEVVQIIENNYGTVSK